MAQLNGGLNRLVAFQEPGRPHDQFAEIHGLMVGLGAFIALVDGGDLKAFLRGDLLLLVVARVFFHLLGEREIAFVVVELVLGA